MVLHSFFLFLQLFMAYHASHINSILAAREETFPTAQDMLGTILLTFLLLVLPLGHQTITPFRYRPFSYDRWYCISNLYKTDTQIAILCLKKSCHLFSNSSKRVYSF
jgi:hypothetical protein